MPSTSDRPATRAHLLVRADAGRLRGAGHVMRCLAVAAEARERDWEVTMSADLSALSWVRPWIESLGVEVVGAAETVESLISLVDSIQADAVLLDHYDFPDVLSAITGKGVVLANFEDGQFGRRAAHLSIDYTLGAESVNRPDDGSLTCLRGIRFAPIRAEVRAGRPLPREPLPGRPMVAVLLGGTDAHELATRVSALVEQVGAHTQVIEGALTFVSQLRPIDAVVSAAGVSAYELACLGIPTALLQVVDNQGANYVAMVGAGAATGLGTAAELHGKPTLVAERLRVWLSDPALLSSIAKVAQQLVDGQGASRIVAALDATSESLSRP